MQKQEPRKTDAAAELTKVALGRFEKKSQLNELHQRIAEEVHPARADFTTERTLGDEYARDLYESTPCLNRRDLAYAMGALTRPDDRQWFDYKPQDETRDTPAARAWLSSRRDKQRTLLYNRNANFQTAMHQGDNDFVSFGNAIHSHTEDPKRGRLVIYDTHHPRDCAWAEDRQRQVVEMHRKFKISLANWGHWFKTVEMPQRYKDIYDKNPHHEIELIHSCFPRDRYSEFYEPRFKGRNLEFASVYIDPTMQMLLLEGGYNEFPYTVRRWILGDDSPYAYSPAGMLGLIDARLLQSQARVILEAGERVVDPPLLARLGGVLGQVNSYPGWVNWLDANYDERHGEALRPLDTGANIPLGLEMKQDTREVLASAWFINKLTLPPEKDMTAFEVNERISEYIRSIGPAVKPFETDNARLLDVSFNMNLRLGHFGDMTDLPQELADADITYEFDGPIQMAYKRQQFQKARETVAFWGEMVATTNKPELLDNVDLDQIGRDASESLGGPPNWLRAEQARDELREAAAEKQMEMEQMATASDAVDIANRAGDIPAKLAQANQSMPAVLSGMETGNDNEVPYPEEDDVNAELAAA